MSVTEKGGNQSQVDVYWTKDDIATIDQVCAYFILCYQSRIICQALFRLTFFSSNYLVFPEYCIISLYG